MQLSALGTLDLGFKKPIKKHDKEVVGPRGAKCFILGLSLGVGWIRKGQVVTQEKEASSFTLLPREFTHWKVDTEFGSQAQRGPCAESGLNKSIQIILINDHIL